MKLLARCRQFVWNRFFPPIDLSGLDDFLQTMSVSAIKPIAARTTPLSQPGTHVVYSTYCGPKRRPGFIPQRALPGADHIFFSNNPDVLRDMERAGWTPRHLELPILNNKVYSAYQSKLVKVLPHLLGALKPYPHTMYVDDTIAFNPAHLPVFEQQLQDEGTAISARMHYFLQSSILHELTEGMGQARYFALRERASSYVLRQLDRGLSLKPALLYMTGSLFRNAHHTDAVLLNETWYQEILECGIHCQIPFDFIAQRFRVSTMCASIH